MPATSHSSSTSIPASTARPPFPFVVGCGRSGTTLVRAMLDSHPELAIPPESYFVSELAAEWAPGRAFAFDDLLARLRGHDRFARWGLAIDAVAEAGAAARPQTFADGIRCAFAAYAREKGKPRYGDKTPRYVQDLALLAELFPEARFVHVIRDGRDVALSFLDREWGPKTVEEAARRWRKRVKAGRRAASSLEPGRYLEVRYEDLFDDPSAELERVCALVEVDPAPEMLRYFERAGEVIAGTKYPDQHSSVAAPPTKGLRDWRTAMSPADVAAFEATAGNLLEELGYERAAR